jgi:hypothetical protein
MLPSQFVEFLEQTKTLLWLLYHKQEIKILILRNLVRQVWLLIFYSDTKVPTMNYSYFLRIFWSCLWGILFEGSKIQFRKIVSGSRVSVRSLYKKMITVACPTDKGGPGRLTIVANEWAGPGLFEWRTICFSPFNLQPNFVSRFLRQPSSKFDDICFWFFLKSTSIHLWHCFVCNSISWMLFIHLILLLITTTYK